MMSTQLRPFHTLLTIVAASALPCMGLSLRVFSPTNHLRMNGFSANPTVNPSFLNPGGGASGVLDLSGVGWSVEDTTKQVTLVSPRHFVGANHFRPGVGSTIRFLARDNSLHTLTILKISPIPNANNSPSDVYLGEFTADMPVSAAVLPLPYLNLATEAAYVSQQLVVVGQAARGGRGVIGSVSDFGGDPITGGAGIATRAFTFSYAAIGGAADDAYAQAGDSGSPSFVVNTSGKAALVGTHTAVLNASGTITTYDTLVPHYAPKLNGLMDATGLHLRKIDPSATSLSASGAPTASVRAASPYVLRLSVTNGSAAADNVTASLDVPPGFQITGIQAPGWFVTGPSTLRRGGLAAGETVQFDVAVTSAPADGMFTVTLNLKSDGSASQSFPLQIATLPSFAGWASGLLDATLTGDSDQDGISNLIEYASGGDNRSGSVYFPGTATPLLPVFSSVPPTLSFIRRTDAAARGLSYVVETSDTLTAGSWQSLGQVPISVTPGPGSGFERAQAVLPANAAAKAFYRLRIGLAE